MSVSQRLLIIALWIGWLCYWVVSSRGVKKAVRTESDLSKILQSYPLIIGGVLIVVPRFGRLLDTEMISGMAGDRYWYLFSVSLVVIGLAFTVWARRHLGSNWSVSVVLRENHELIRSGPYAIVRHPIYSGALLAVLGAALATDQWRGLAGVVLIASSLVYKVSLEERWLGELFGEAYERYCAEVSALLPWVY